MSLSDWIIVLKNRGIVVIRLIRREARTAAFDKRITRSVWRYLEILLMERVSW